MINTRSIEIVEKPYTVLITEDPYSISYANATTIISIRPLITQKVPFISSQTSTISMSKSIEENYFLYNLVSYFNTKHVDELLYILYKNEYLQILLWDAINFIYEESHDKAIRFRIGISLEKEDPEDPEQRIVFVLVCGKWKFKNFNERLDFTVRVLKYIENRKNDYLKIAPSDNRKIEEAYSLISVFIGEEGDDCETLSTR
ncbi:MAG: hypothetical protein J7K59_07360 [Candidatus Korarchaeota archaeon]|nr:hypothetical protein [Candidatus Korarchaeota archaeon]